MIASRWMVIACMGLACIVSPSAFGQIQEPFQDRLLRENLWRQVVALPKEERPRVGLVLSAGGFRGLAHVGVIKVLEDAGFPIDVIAGTSMGAVIGSLYAAGLPMSKLVATGSSATLTLGSDFNTMRVFWLFLTDHLLSTKRMEKFITDSVGNKDFYELSKPFACVAMDIKTGEPIIFREGPLAPAVRASMNLPGVFAPVEYRHRYLVDGGVVDYIPVDAAKLLGAEWIISSVTEGDYRQTAPTNVLMTLEQVIDIRGALLSRQQRRQSNVVIEPDVGNIMFYDSRRSQEAVEKGVVAAKAKLRQAKENLILFTMPRLWTHWIHPR